MLADDRPTDSALTSEQAFWDDLSRFYVVDLVEDSRFVPACEAFIEGRKRLLCCLDRPFRTFTSKIGEESYDTAHNDLLGLALPFFERYESPTKLVLADQRIGCVGDTWGNRLHEFRWLDERKWPVPKSMWW